MAYTKQTWTDGVSKLNATRMQHIEDGLEAAAIVADGAVAKSLVDAKGDLLVGTAADTVGRLAVGTNNQLLVADSAQATGHKWALLTNSMVDAAAAIALSKLSGFPSDPTKFARGDGTWAAPAAALGYGTSLPVSPSDGDEYVLVDSTSAPTYRWHVRYNSGSGSSFKWEFIGGTPMRHEIATDESSNSTAYTDLTTTGPTLTLPNAGDYIVEFGMTAGNTSSANSQHWAAVKIGAAATADTAGIATLLNGDGTLFNSAARSMTLTGQAASTVLKMQYKTSAGTAHYKSRFMHIRPIRIS